MEKKTNHLKYSILDKLENLEKNNLLIAYVLILTFIFTLISFFLEFAVEILGLPNYFVLVATLLRYFSYFLILSLTFSMDLQHYHNLKKEIKYYKDWQLKIGLEKGKNLFNILPFVLLILLFLVFLNTENSKLKEISLFSLLLSLEKSIILKKTIKLHDQELKRKKLKNFV